MMARFILFSILLFPITNGVSEEKQSVPTYSKDVAPVIQAKCVECHRDGGGTPFSLMDYRSVKRKARTIARVVEDLYMPPWHAVGGDVPLEDDRRLSDQQRELIDQWIKAGLPEGNPDQLPPPREFPKGWSMGEPDLILKMEEVYHLPADGADIYRNFVIRSGLKKTKYLKAIAFRPSSPSVVHHALFYADTSGRARQVDQADEEPGFAEMPIGQGTGQTIGGWVPGAKARPLPPGLARVIKPNSEIVVQIHFHPSGKPETEQAEVGLYFSDKPPTRSFTSIQLPPVFGALSGIDLPPGEDHIEIRDSFVVPVAVKAFGAQPHSHYRGKSLSLAAHLPNGESVKLLNIPEWDMDWQEEYRFAKAITLPAGTRLDACVTWDNSASSPENPVLPPVRVRWGLESFDEMGSIDLFVVPVGKDRKKADAAMKTLRNRYREHITWKAGSHVLKPDKLAVFGKLRDQAIAKYDSNGNGILEESERAKARQALKETSLQSTRDL